MNMTAAFEDAYSAADKVDAVPELEETVVCRMTLGVQAVTKMAPQRDPAARMSATV
jgi:hypothetical protein